MKKGFTLIELLIACAIIGILAGIAVPSYRDAQIKTKIAGALAVLHTTDITLLYPKDEKYIYDQQSWWKFSNLNNPLGQTVVKLNSGFELKANSYMGEYWFSFVWYLPEGETIRAEQNGINFGYISLWLPQKKYEALELFNIFDRFRKYVLTGGRSFGAIMTLKQLP